MKLIFTLFTILLSTTLMAQTPCTPGTKSINAKGYILPDSATGLLHACPGFLYKDIIYIKAPIDSVVTLPLVGTIPVKVDSFVIDSMIVNLPNYIKTNSNPALKPANIKSNFTHITVAGDSMACISLSGLVPTSAAAASYNLTFKIRAFLRSVQLGLSIDTALNVTYFKFVVDPSTSAYCINQNNSKIEIVNSINIYPNPTMDNLNINFETPISDDYQIELLNLLGQPVLTENKYIRNGYFSEQLDLKHLENGMYFLKISNSEGSVTKKINKN